MELDDATRSQIEGLVAGHEVVLFMKGTRAAPQCGFSAKVVGILDSLLADYYTVDVLAEPAVREGIKVFSSWPTIPQLYVKGEFVGGCDIVEELHGSGELRETLGVLPGPEEAPALEVTPAAAEGLRRAAQQTPGGQLHLAIDARFRNQLYVAPPAPGELSAESNGVVLWMDRLTAGRAAGAVIDVVDTPQGLGFKIDNPNAPAE